MKKEKVFKIILEVEISGISDPNSHEANAIIDELTELSGDITENGLSSTNKVVSAWVDEACVYDKNACLIDAAPDLLALLREVHDAVADGNADFSPSGDWFRAASTAIAKATSDNKTAANARIMNSP